MPAPMMTTRDMAPRAHEKRPSCASADAHDLVAATSIPHGTYTRGDPPRARFPPPPPLPATPFQGATSHRSGRPGQGPDFAELARQLGPAQALIGGAVDFAADAAGVDQGWVGGMHGEVPDRAIG